MIGMQILPCILHTQFIFHFVQNSDFTGRVLQFFIRLPHRCGDIKVSCKNHWNITPVLCKHIKHSANTRLIRAGRRCMYA